MYVAEKEKPEYLLESVSSGWNVLGAGVETQNDACEWFTRTHGSHSLQQDRRPQAVLSHACRSYWNDAGTSITAAGKNSTLVFTSYSFGVTGPRQSSSAPSQSLRHVNTGQCNLISLERPDFDLQAYSHSTSRNSRTTACCSSGSKTNGSRSCTCLDILYKL